MDHQQTLRHRNLIFAALTELIRRRLRSAVATLCLAAILFPLVTALAISEGLRFQAEIGVNEGAAFYISKDLLGGDGPIPLSLLNPLRSISGVYGATPRVVGRTYFVDRLIAVVGLEEKSISHLKSLVRGEIPKAPGEVLLGEEIARTFGIRQGMRFTVAANKGKLLTLTGTISPSCLWGSDLMVMAFRDANEFFRIEGLATQLLIYAPPQAAPRIIRAVEGQGGPSSPKHLVFQIKDRKRIREMLGSGYSHRGGIFSLLYIIGAALAIPAFLVTSGLGLREQHRELGVLRAIGWRRWEVMEKVTFENIFISLSAASISILLSMAWIKGFNGIFIAQFYVAEVGLIPHVDIPSRYLPSHGLFCLIIALSITMMGGLFSTWIRSLRSPMELMRE